MLCHLFLLSFENYRVQVAIIFFDTRLGDRSTASLTAATFSGVRTLLGLPVDFLFKAEPVALKFETHNSIVLRSGTGACLPSAK